MHRHTSPLAFRRMETALHLILYTVEGVFSSMTGFLYRRVDWTLRWERMYICPSSLIPTAHTITAPQLNRATNIADCPTLSLPSIPTQHAFPR